MILKRLWGASSSLETYVEMSPKERSRSTSCAKNIPCILSCCDSKRTSRSDAASFSRVCSLVGSDTEHGRDDAEYEDVSPLAGSSVQNLRKVLSSRTAR